MRSGMVATLLVSAIGLQGCASMSNSLYGPQRPFQAGKMGGVASCPANAAGQNFLEDRFVAAACGSASSSLSDADSKARAMLEASFSLTNARCTDYFAQKAGTQTGVNTFRSSIAPVLTLLTGVLSIVNFKNDINGSKRADWEQGLSLASTAALAGLTVYEENFLFSAENIDDVRGLTKHAMSEYRTAVLNLQGHTFDTSVDYTLEYHMICTPGKIKGLVKQAIRDKKITVVDRGTGATVAPAVAPAPAPAGVGLTIE